MARADVVVFDIRGPYGHFRKPYSLMSPVTFPVPPPTALLGVVGAIVGYGKREYLEVLGQGEVGIGIQLLSPVKKFRVTLNVLRTKNSRYFQPKASDPRTQISHEFLKDAAYRVFFRHSNSEVTSSLAELLRSDRTTYTPCLGLAQCIATTSYVGIYPAELQTFDQSIRCDSVVPVSDAIDVEYELGRRFQRVRMPARMRSDRTVTRYTEVVIAEDAGPIHVKGEGAHRVGDSCVFFL